MPGAVDPQELLIRAMIGQQITVAAARTALTQLSAAGSASLVPDEGLDRLFPTAAEIAGPGYRCSAVPSGGSTALRSAASALAAGELDFGYGDDLPGLEAKLLPLPGVGPWTVGYVAMRVLGAPDVFLANDAAVRNGIRALAETPDGADPVRPDFREVSPWRSYATMHLWRAQRRPAAAQGPAAEAVNAEHSSRESEAMKAQLLTMSTPDGPFTILAQDGVVLASGWTADPGELTGQIHPQLLSGRVGGRDRISAPISRAVEAFYAGDPAPAMAVPVLQKSGPFRATPGTC